MYTILLTGYWHQVRSYGSKNMAVSVLFSRLKEFNPSGCNETEYAPISLADAGMVWTYSGHGPQTLGNSDPFEFRYIVIITIIITGAIHSFGSFYRSHPPPPPPSTHTHTLPHLNGPYTLAKGRFPLQSFCPSELSEHVLTFAIYLGI